MSIVALVRYKYRLYNKKFVLVIYREIDGVKSSLFRELIQFERGDLPRGFQ